jgi:pimeloyl-ACP methyl ester carboxylesterase
MPKRLRKLRNLTLAALALYLILLTLAYTTHLVDSLIISTATGKEDPRGATQLLLPFQNGQLEIFTAQSPACSATGGGGPKAFILLFVGNEDRADKYPGPMAAALADKPVEIWGVNYPGFGASTGPAHLDRFGPAALAAYDALAKKAHGKPILVRGASLGTLGALCVAAHRNIAALTLHNPLPLPELIRGQHGWWNLWLLAGPASLWIPTDINGIQNAQRSTAPATFLLADSDEVIPPKFQQQIVQAYAGPKTTITLKNAHHNSPMDKDAQSQLHAAETALWKTILPP